MSAIGPKTSALQGPSISGPRSDSPAGPADAVEKGVAGTPAGPDASLATTFERATTTRVGQLLGSPTMGAKGNLGSSEGAAIASAVALANSQPGVAAALGRASHQVREDPAKFLTGDGSVKPDLGTLVRRELDSAHGALQPDARATWSILGAMDGQDIEALAFLVLMAASKSAQEDLKAIMHGVKAINDAKSKVREVLSDVNQEAAALGSKIADGAPAGADGPPGESGDAIAEGARRLELAVAKGPRVVGWPPD